MGLDLFEDLFQRKQAAFQEVMDAVSKLKKVLPALSGEEREVLLKDLSAALGVQQPASSDSAALLKAVEGERLTPAGAVITILHRHRRGLRAKDILRLCAGRFDTSSDDPKSVLYSAIAHLKRLGRIVQNENKTYRIASKNQSDSDGPTDEFAGKKAIFCCLTILGERGKPMHAMEIAREALRRGYVGKKTGTREQVEGTTFKSFWAAMGRDDRFVQTAPETYVLKPPGNVQIKRDSWPARVATKLKETNHPMSLKELAAIFVAEGHGGDLESVENNLVSAVWRRKADLFERRNGLVHLRTRDFELVD